VLETLICDAHTDEVVADLTGYAQRQKISPRLSRPLSSVITVPGDAAVVRGSAADGLPVIWPGRRTLKTLRNGSLIANPILWTVAPSGDENTTSIDLSGYDPLILSGGRYVRDGTGNLIDPDFASPIASAAVIVQAFSNSVAFVGDLPLDLTSGSLDELIPPAIDIAAELTDWPMLISDLIRLLAGARACDVVVDPLDHAHLGAAPGVLGRLNVVNHYGSDISSLVHFDYGTGDYSIANVQRSFDMSTVVNRLRYFLGPKLDSEHWKGSIESSDAGLTAYHDLEFASRDLFWTIEAIKVFDSAGIENSARPLWQQAFKTDVTLRTQPRQLLQIIPAAGSGSPFQPYDDYFLGDTVATNLADIIGPELIGGQQRLYGFDLEQAEDDVERVTSLEFSPDGL
jgi:hypothetical protein